MATRRTTATTAAAPGVDAGRVLARYRRWLARQPLAERARGAYRAQVSAYLTWLAGSGHGPAALSDPAARDRTVRAYKRHAKAAPRRWSPASTGRAGPGRSSTGGGRRA